MLHIFELMVHVMNIMQTILMILYSHVCVGVCLYDMYVCTLCVHMFAIWVFSGKYGCCS